MYSYREERHRIFTEEGQLIFIKYRDNAKRMLEDCGAFKCMRPFTGISVGDTWFMLAIVDRMVEIGDIREVTDSSVSAQDRVFVAK